MKKIFKLQDEKKHADRVLEAIKHEIRKYAKRESKKKLPESASMYWDFDCRIGQDFPSSQVIKFEELTKVLDNAKESGWTECYVEILARAANKPLKTPKPVPEELESKES
ncbi:MAG TPA: hypothetical protein CFH81_01570 [Sulfurovum sp. UBA12169]|nr:MAG TPA: hypothetical protein CFH81_01570 [Sulfurovum sp. UBA12169]